MTALMRTLPLVISTIAAVISVHAADGHLRPGDLRTEYLANPEGLDAARPRLQWRVESDIRGQMQTAYRILVAGSPEKLDRDEGDLWDSGKVTGDATNQIAYAGKPLRSGQPCWWKVMVWDKAGKASAWSPAARWSMGLLKPEDWKAQWISFKDETPLHKDRNQLSLPPARHYRKAFGIKRGVKRAMAYVSALGIADVSIDGLPVGGQSDGIGAEYFAPGWSDYRERAYYRAYDVTGLVDDRLRSDVLIGERRPHILGAVVADGWYAGYVGYGLLVGYGPNKTGRNIYGKTPALLVQLEVEYEDGSREIIGTDPTWETSGDGPYREADLLMGEAYDATKASSLWCAPAIHKQPGAPPDPGDSWKWEPAILADQNGSTRATFFDPLGPREVELGFQAPKRLAAYTAPPIRCTQGLCVEAPAKEIKPGVWIFDFQQNFAGNVILTVRGEPGTKVTLRYGEMLHPDGTLMTENLRRARATDTYIIGPSGAGRWTPRFTYHGFRYVEVTGLPGKPKRDTLVGQVIHNDTPMRRDSDGAFESSFECSDPVLTQFWRNTVWTQRANFIEVPTDCPQRDERLGWMGDAQIYARTATYNADVAAFFTKWLDDVAEAQRDSGAYPDYCPYPFAHGAAGATHGTAWTDAGVIVPHTMWRVYGDTRLLERQWPSMAKFMDWRRRADPDLKGVKIGNTWGDWLNVGENTPIEYIDLCYHRISAVMMGELAAALGKADEAAQFRATADALAESFRKQYIQPDGRLSVDTQTAYVLALDASLFAGPDEAHALAGRLAEKIIRNDTRMATGFLGTKPLLPVLSAHGQNDLALRLFQSRRFPSWGYEVEQGATSVWERWDSFTKEHGFEGATGKNNAAMNSFSHYAFGAVMQWAFQTLAGIDTEGAGFRRIIIRPHPPSPAATGDPKPIEWVKARYKSIHGTIDSGWRASGAGFELHTSIPPNTTATVYLPATDPATVTESGKPITDAPDVKHLRTEPGCVVLEVGSGAYHFQSRR